MARVICPFCLKPHDFTASLICPDYKAETPAVYVKEYNRVPPLWLVTIGFSRHGKSCYLNALTRLLEEISRVWSGVYYRPLDQYTFQTIQQIRRDAQSGAKPIKTPLGEVTRPMLLSVYDLPRAGSRCLVMYDVPGEVYDSLTDLKDYVASIKQVTTTWFLVSLSDLEIGHEGKNITDLFSVYLSGMERMRADLRGRNLIVVYTKGDKFVPREREIRSYLMDDPLRGLLSPDTGEGSTPQVNLAEYLESMRSMSDQLEEYTRQRVKGGAAFINMVKANGMNLVFSVVSALGQDPDASAQSMELTPVPMRVIDPFLWAITLESASASSVLGLALDAAPGSDAVFGSATPSRLAEALSGFGELTTYYLGQAKPAGLPGQEPPSVPPRTARPRLVGPILERATPGTRVLIVTTGPVLDLADFRKSEWRDRLLLVSLADESVQDWPNATVWRADEDPMVLADALLRQS